MENTDKEIDYEGISENLADENIELTRKLTAAFAEVKVLEEALKYIIGEYCTDEEAFCVADDALARVKAMREGNTPDPVKE